MSWWSGVLRLRTQLSVFSLNIHHISLERRSLAAQFTRDWKLDKPFFFFFTKKNERKKTQQEAKVAHVTESLLITRLFPVRLGASMHFFGGFFVVKF